MVKITNINKKEVVGNVKTISKEVAQPMVVPTNQQVAKDKARSTSQRTSLNINKRMLKDKARAIVLQLARIIRKITPQNHLEEGTKKVAASMHRRTPHNNSFLISKTYNKWIHQRYKSSW